MTKKTESQEQQKLVLKLRWLHPDLVFFAIPNGGKRTPSEARKLVLEGVESGTPDMFICESSKGFNGLFLELKTKKGKASDAQLQKKIKLEQKGYKVEIVKCFDAAYKVIVDYLTPTDNMLF